MTKKQFYSIAKIHNWIVLASFICTILVMLPFSSGLPYYELLSVFFPLLFLVMGAISLILAGVAGVVYQDTTTVHSIYDPGRVYRLRGKNAVHTGIVYISLGIFLISGLAYIFWSTGQLKKQMRQEDASVLEQFKKQQENYRHRLPDYSP